MQTEVLLYSVIAYRDMKRAGQLTGEIEHGLGTHLNDLSRYISLAVLRICCATKHGTRDRVGTEHLYFVVSPGYGGDLLLMAGRTRRGAINAKLATSKILHRERPAIATRERFPFLICRFLAQAFHESPFGAGRILSPSLGAARIAFWSFGFFGGFLLLRLGVRGRAGEPGRCSCSGLLHNVSQLMSE